MNRDRGTFYDENLENFLENRLGLKILLGCKEDMAFKATRRERLFETKKALELEGELTSESRKLDPVQVLFFHLKEPGL